MDEHDMVTVKDVLARVEDVRAKSGDYEAAHLAEDEMRSWLLRAISEDRCQRVKDCCRAALLTEEIDFERWCA